MYALMRDGSVCELFERDPLLPRDLEVRDVSEVPGIAVGWRRTHDGWTAPPIPPAPVPASVSAVQALTLLIATPGRRRATLYEDLEDHIRDAPLAVQIAYQRAQTWERSNPFIAQIQALLGMTDAEVDDLFRQAAATVIG